MIKKGGGGGFVGHKKEQMKGINFGTINHFSFIIHGI
jgi:hypothetical protein